MVGSSASISGPNIVLNTAVAEELKQFADILEKADDFEGELHSLIQKTIKEHKRIIFNGNGMTMHGLKKLSAASFELKDNTGCSAVLC